METLSLTLAAQTLSQQLAMQQGLPLGWGNMSPRGRISYLTQAQREALQAMPPAPAASPEQLEKHLAAMYASERLLVQRLEEGFTAYGLGEERAREVTEQNLARVRAEIPQVEARIRQLMREAPVPLYEPAPPPPAPPAPLVDAIPPVRPTLDFDLVSTPQPPIRVIEREVGPPGWFWPALVVGVLFLLRR